MSISYCSNSLLFSQSHLCYLQECLQECMQWSSLLEGPNHLVVTPSVSLVGVIFWILNSSFVVSHNPFSFLSILNTLSRLTHTPSNKAAPEFSSKYWPRTDVRLFSSIKESSGIGGPSKNSIGIHYPFMYLHYHGWQFVSIPTDASKPSALILVKTLSCSANSKCLWSLHMPTPKPFSKSLKCRNFVKSWCYALSMCVSSL